MIKRPALVSIILGASLLLSGCTSVLSDAKATPPVVKLATQDGVNADSAFTAAFGSGTNKADFQSAWMYYCQGGAFEDPADQTDAAPYESGKSNQTAPVLTGQSTDIGAYVWVPKTASAAKKFTETAISSMKNCASTDSGTVGSGSSKLNYNATNSHQDYSDSGWSGHLVFNDTKYSDGTKAMIGSFVISKTNTVVMTNLYDYQYSSADLSKSKMQDAMKKFLATLKTN